MPWKPLNRHRIEYFRQSNVKSLLSLKAHHFVFYGYSVTRINYFSVVEALRMP